MLYVKIYVFHTRVRIYNIFQLFDKNETNKITNFYDRIFEILAVEFRLQIYNFTVQSNFTL